MKWQSLLRFIYFSSLLAFLTDLVDHPYDVLSTVTITFVLFPSIYCCSSALPIVLISQLHKCFWLVLLKRHHIWYRLTVPYARCFDVSAWGRGSLRQANSLIARGFHCEFADQLNCCYRTTLPSLRLCILFWFYR